MMINFGTLLDLAYELDEEDNSLAAAIGHLALFDVPMSDAVIKLGIICGALEDDYVSGWSDEVIED